MCTLCCGGSMYMYACVCIVWYGGNSVGAHCVVVEVVCICMYVCILCCGGGGMYTYVLCVLYDSVCVRFSFSS